MRHCSRECAKVKAASIASRSWHPSCITDGQVPNHTKAELCIFVYTYEEFRKNAELVRDSIADL